jgi:predicted nucleic acid-binding protein
MASARRASSPGAPRRRARLGRYTIDASIFVNAFNPHEDGHEASLALLASIHETSDPIIAPTLLVPEIAAAIGRVTGDATGAVAYARATAALPHLTLPSLGPAMARQAADLAAAHRLRAADAVYVAVARRYGTTLVSRDEEQRTRGSTVVACRTPEEALAERREIDTPARRRRPARPRR